MGRVSRGKSRVRGERRVAGDRKRLPRTPGIAVPFSSIDMPGEREGDGEVCKVFLNCEFQQGHLLWGGTKYVALVALVVVTSEERWLWWWRRWWWWQL
jgi:hypothetical protein